MRVFVLFAFLGLTSPIGSLAIEGTCGSSGPGCQPSSPSSDKSAMMQIHFQLHADAADNSSAVETTKSSSTVSLDSSAVSVSDSTTARYFRTSGGVPCPGASGISSEAACRTAARAFGTIRHFAASSWPSLQHGCFANGAYVLYNRISGNPRSRSYAMVCNRPQNCAGVWLAWSACSTSCGGGSQSRGFSMSRSAAYGGASCPSPQSQPCNADACPVDCVGSWQAWSSCSRPCGGGQQSRSYAIATQSANGGIQCPSPESQPCSPQPCPVNCAGSWDMWSVCSEECGGGSQTRTFSVTAAASHGGAECPTPESQQCSLSPCPVHCQGSFAAWGPCSKSCGGGTQSRTFNITTQATHGGDDCPASPESQACNIRECPVDCAGSWQEWSPCSLECAGGTRSRIFTVTVQENHDGIVCPTSPDAQVCNAHRCPVDCEGSWREWGPCSRDCGCGGGTQSAAFNVSVPSAYNGTACPSPKTQVCNDHPCDSYGTQTTSVPSTAHAGCQGVSTTHSPTTEAPTTTSASNQGESTAPSPTTEAPTTTSASNQGESSTPSPTTEAHR